MAIRILQTTVAETSGVALAQQQMSECLKHHKEALMGFTLPPLHGESRVHAHGVAGSQGPIDPNILAPALG